MHKHKHYHKHCRKCKKRKRHAYDLYLRRKYGITLKERDRMDKDQRYKCAGCKRPPKKNKLAVDHSHWIAKLKVKSFKRGKYWNARVDEFPEIRKKDKVRKKAIKAAKLALLRRSVRGLLCCWCNIALQKFRDNPETMIRAGKYLQKYNKKLEKLGYKRKG